jgi:hypothetical protein
MKPKKTISANILLVGLMTLLMVGSFVIFQIYSALTKSQISELQEKAIKPLDGKIKEEVVQNLGNRKWFNRLELDRPIVIYAPETPTSNVSIEEPAVENPPEASETGKVEQE